MDQKETQKIIPQGQAHMGQNENVRKNKNPQKPPQCKTSGFTTNNSESGK